MPEQVIIDGNNLLHAMHAHAPLPTIGRETLVKVVERWAGQSDNDVTLVFDGPTPREGLAKQMTSRRITVRFSAPMTADDIIVAMIQRAKDPGRVRVVTGDTAIRREVRYRRCLHTDVVSFITELFPGKGETRPPQRSAAEKQDKVSPQETREWLDMFGYEDDESEPFDGYGAMGND